ncbi:Rid family hydrolase [Nakamurella sp. A5-74]|uniref:Rid family hydrolase n=1 Tax=Nakamurella sp. A5-74 TaxID=3158264 RepID=A0AAU8DLN1_9ACTN
MPDIIITGDSPASPLYNQGTRAGGFIWTSGMAGIDAATGAIAGPTIREQTRQSIINCAAILAAAGASLADVVEVGVLLADPNDFAGLNEEWTAAFPENPPTRSVAKLGAVIPGVLVSIRMTAYHPA